MRRLLILAVALVAILGVLAPPAMAQAPAPKVTITGLIDQAASYERNTGSTTANLARNEHMMYGRTRGRFDVIGEVGKAKAVLGLEIDAYWGQTGLQDSNMGPGCSSTPSSSGNVQCGSTGPGAESSFDLNTDTQGSIQVKWLYTEFPLPLIPLNSVVRLGGQPFGTAATYKLATYANGDFPGVNLVVDVAPGAKLNLTYVAVDENLTGKANFFPVVPHFLVPVSGVQSQPNCKDQGAPAGGVTGTEVIPSCVAQNRGDNFAFIASFEMSPFKGLDVKPMYSYFFANGNTSVAARQGRGGLGITNAISGVSAGQIANPFAPGPGGGSAAGPGSTWSADGSGTGIHENRHTIGVDSRFTAGPFSLQPTVLYQFGSRQAVIQSISGGANLTLAPYGNLGQKYTADINAWLIDIRGGFNVGPLSLGAMGMWTSGNHAQDNPFRSVRFFQALDTDTGYMADWGLNILALGIDYYQILNGLSTAAGVNPGVAIGYDKYGRKQVAVKASYALTPALTVGTGVTAAWTDTSVDTNAVLLGNAGLLPSFYCRTTGVSCRPEGTHNFLGTELNAALTYRFAPGLAFDLAAGYLFAGNALGHRFVPTSYAVTAPSSKDGMVNDVIITSARVRYQF